MTGETGGVGEAITRVADDAKAYAAAQIGLYKAMAFARVRAAKTGVVFGAVAAVLAIAAFGALLIGLIFSLTPIAGPFGATAIVVGGTLVVAAILGVVAGKSLSRAFGGDA